MGFSPLLTYVLTPQDILARSVESAFLKKKSKWSRMRHVSFIRVRSSPFTLDSFSFARSFPVRTQARFDPSLKSWMSHPFFAYSDPLPFLGDVQPRMYPCLPTRAICMVLAQRRDDWENVWIRKTAPPCKTMGRISCLFSMLTTLYSSHHILSINYRDYFTVYVHTLVLETNFNFRLN